MKTVTFADEQVRELVNGGFVPLAVDPTSDAELIKELKITAYPTTLVISPDEGLLDQFKGYLPPAEFVRRLNRRRLQAAAAPPRSSRRYTAAPTVPIDSAAAPLAQMPANDFPKGKVFLRLRLGREPAQLSQEETHISPLRDVFCTLCHEPFPQTTTSGGFCSGSDYRRRKQGDFCGF